MASIYTNNLKNREFDKEAAQIFCSGESDHCRRQGASEDKKFAAKPTQSKIDSSGCLCISATTKQNYTRQVEIDRGVWKGIDEKGNAVALKIFQNKDKFLHERRILDALKGKPHIIRLLDSYQTKNEYVLVFPYYSRGNMHKAACHQNLLDLRNMSRQLCYGVKTMHDAWHTHNDLKPENLLLSDRGELVFCDLGSASNNIRFFSSKPLYTPGYVSPEALFGLYTYSSDVWSAGCIIGEHYTNEVLFPRTNGIDCEKNILLEIAKKRGAIPSQILDNKKRLESLGLSDSDLKWIAAQKDTQYIENLIQKTGRGRDSVVIGYVSDLVNKTLQLNPKNRPTAKDLCAHPFHTNTSHLRFCLSKDSPPKKDEYLFFCDSNDNQIYSTELQRLSDLGFEEDLFRSSEYYLSYICTYDEAEKNYIVNAESEVTLSDSTEFCIIQNPEDTSTDKAD